MSILDALRVQKANQQSVSQLAMLPQKEIIRLAQLGHIPADVVPVVISEKARMAQESAQMKAASQMQQQGGQMPTVIEQAMQANAQAEMPEPGLAGLPTEQMFQGQNFQSGGIVAFEDGGQVADVQPKELMRAFANVQRDKATGKDIEVLMAGLGMDEGMIGINVAKIPDAQRDDLAKTLVAQYGTRFGDLDVSGSVVRPLDAPPGVYGLGAMASYPLGQGRVSAGVNAMRTPERTATMGYNIGYGGRVGPGQLAANVNIPTGGQRPMGQLTYKMPFAEGGIVAFNGEDGSFVEGPTGLKMLREEANGDKKRPSSLAEMIGQVKGLATEARRETPEETALREARKKGVLSPEDIKQQQYMRLLQAGLGIMGGTSPYALTNIGAGAQEALKGYAEDIKSQRALQMENLKAAAETARAKRGEEMQDIALGAQLYGQQVDREQRERIAKESQLGAKYADNYVAMKRTQGDKRPEEVIRDEGYNKFFENYGYASQRAQIGAITAAGQQALGYAGLTERNIRDARTSVDQALSNPGSQESKDFRRMRKDDPTLTIDDYRQSLVLKRAHEAAAAARAMQEQGVGTPQQRPAAPSAQPSKPNISTVTGAPAGSKVGNFVQGRGWEVLGSDGKLIGYVQQ